MAQPTAALQPCGPAGAVPPAGPVSPFAAAAAAATCGFLEHFGGLSADAASGGGSSPPLPCFPSAPASLGPASSCAGGSCGGSGAAGLFAVRQQLFSSESVPDVGALSLSSDATSGSSGSGAGTGTSAGSSAPLPSALPSLCLSAATLQPPLQQHQQQGLPPVGFLFGAASPARTLSFYNDGAFSTGAGLSALPDCDALLQPQPSALCPTSLGLAAGLHLAPPRGGGGGDGAAAFGSLPLHRCASADAVAAAAAATQHLLCTQQLQQQQLHNLHQLQNHPTSPPQLLRSVSQQSASLSTAYAGARNGSGGALQMPALVRGRSDARALHGSVGITPLFDMKRWGRRFRPM
jgi:hypothetical protein